MIRPNFYKSTTRVAELPCTYEGLLSAFCLSTWFILATLAALVMVQP